LGNVAVAELLIGSVILPRIESPKAISRLAEFECFINWICKMRL